jgi:hypothetical protein
MPEGLRPLVISTDIDRTALVGPMAWSTLIQLLKRDVKLPDVGKENPRFVEPTSLKGRLKAAIDYKHHAARWPIMWSRTGLQALRMTAEAYGRDVRLVALSGRTPEKHEMTFRRLKRMGFMEILDGVHLNQGKTSYIWKEGSHQRWVDEGANVFHLDDDLRAGLASDRVNQRAGETRVVTCMFENWSNSPYLAKRAGIAIPNSVNHVSGFSQAIGVLNNLLVTGQF